MAEFYFTKGNLIVGAEPDEFFNPREEQSNFGVILANPRNPYVKNEAYTGNWDAFMGRYGLERSGDDWEAMHRDIDSVLKVAKERGDAMLPLTVYDHSGSTVFVGTPAGHFDGKWDCTFVGFIYADADTIKENDIEYDKAIQLLQGEVKELDAWMTNNIYSEATYDLDGNELEGPCGGWIGVEEIISEYDAITDDGITDRNFEHVDDFIAANKDRIAELKYEINGNFRE